MAKFESSEKAPTHALEEARMVMPGIQALFGFQLIAVFNDTFSTKLSAGEQRLHLLAVFLVSLAVMLVMGPAAYHRQAQPESTSHAFVRFASRCLTGAMFALMLGISLDFYLVAALIVGRGGTSAIGALALLTGFFGFWFVWPRINARAK